MRLTVLRPALPLALLLLTGACATVATAPAPAPGPVTALPAAQPASTPVPAEAPALQCPACPVCPQAPVCVPPPAKAEALAAPAFSRADWTALPGWNNDDVAQAWGGLLASCRAIRQAEVVAAWKSTCEAAAALGGSPSTTEVRGFLQSRLQPWQVINTDGTEQGLVTGYYEPLMRGSRTRSSRYNVPVYAVPDDLVQVDLAEVYPDLRNMRLRGRLEGRKLVPYWTRAQIEARGANLPARVIVWAEDAIDFFFLQVQGSGQVELPDGSRLRIAYADQNGHPYVSIGRWLVQQNELKLEQAGMEGIKNWAKARPQRLSELLNQNPSFVFFREEAASGEGPKGSLGVPLAAGRAIAIDPRTVPLGAPVFLATTRPDGAVLNRLVMAQDTGGAIRGRVRADFYWGFGAEAGKQAGSMRSQGRMWVLWPIEAGAPGK